MNIKLRSFQRPIYVKIDLKVAEYIFYEIQKWLNSKTKLCCVIKANEYNHAAVQLLKIYGCFGVDYLVVSNIEKVIQPKNAKIRFPILIFGYTNRRYVVDFVQNSMITQRIFSYDYGKALVENATENKNTVKIYTVTYEERRCA